MLSVNTSMLPAKVSLTATKPSTSIVSPAVNPAIVAGRPAALPSTVPLAPLSNWSGPVGGGVAGGQEPARFQIEPQAGGRGGLNRTKIEDGADAGEEGSVLAAAREPSARYPGGAVGETAAAEHHRVGLRAGRADR